MSSFADQIAEFNRAPVSASVSSGSLLLDRFVALSFQVRVLAFVIEEMYKKRRISMEELNCAIESADFTGEIDEIRGELCEFLGNLRLSDQNGEFDC